MSNYFANLSLLALCAQVVTILGLMVALEILTTSLLALTVGALSVYILDKMTGGRARQAAKIIGTPLLFGAGFMLCGGLFDLASLPTSNLVYSAIAQAAIYAQNLPLLTSICLTGASLLAVSVAVLGISTLGVKAAQSAYNWLFPAAATYNSRIANIHGSHADLLPRMGNVVAYTNSSAFSHTAAPNVPTTSVASRARSRHNRHGQLYQPTPTVIAGDSVNIATPRPTGTNQ